MSLLTIVQDAADLCGVVRPSVIVGSTDTTVRKLLALAKIEGQALYKRHRWTVLDTEVTHTTLAAEDQGTVESIMPGYGWLINQTLWDRTNQNPIGGPRDSADWQNMKAHVVSGSYFDFRIRDGHLYLYPAPAAGLTLALEYGSKYWCQDSGGTGQATWAADTDTGVLDEGLMTLGLRWRFLQADGLDYGEAFREYEIQVAQAIARDGSRPILHMDGGDWDWRGGVRAPDGNWSP
jgi:hypothetical protein